MVTLSFFSFNCWNLEFLHLVGVGFVISICKEIGIQFEVCFSMYTSILHFHLYIYKLKIHPNNKIYSSVDAGAHVWTVTSFFAVLCFACLLSSFVSYSSDMVNVKKLYIWTIFVILSNRFFLVEKLWTSCYVQWTYCIKDAFTINRARSGTTSTNKKKTKHPPKHLAP